MTPENLRSMNMQTIIVALLSAFVGSAVTYLMHRREMGVKMSEVAIGILRAKPDENTRALRDWAVDVLAHYAKHHVPLKAELRSKPLPVHADAVGIALGSNSAKAV